MKYMYSLVPLLVKNQFSSSGKFDLESSNPIELRVISNGNGSHVRRHISYSIL
jgi:hypothetical protein